MTIGQESGQPKAPCRKEAGHKAPKSFPSPIWSLPGLSLARLDLKPVGIEAVGPAHLGEPPRTKSRVENNREWVWKGKHTI